jgi:xanthine dehydrogenase accessory factor
LTPTQVLTFLHSFFGSDLWTLALVASTSGSTPRKPGALMAIADSGAHFGSIGGGRGEAQMLAAILANKALLELKIDLRGGENSLGICGGQMHIRFARPSAERREHALQKLNRGEFVSADTLGFTDSHNVLLTPPQTLVIAGGGHCGAAMAELALTLGYRVICQDDRTADLDLPLECLLCNSWAQVLALLDGQIRPCAVLLTRNDALDVEALHALQTWGSSRTGFDAETWTDAFGYIGMMGSQRRIRAVQSQLAFSLANISAPVGLDIGAETPSEIAVSISAALIAARRQYN